MGREYFAPFFLMGLNVVILVWYHVFALPRLRAKDEPNEAPESHPKSSE